MSSVRLTVVIEGNTEDYYESDWEMAFQAKSWVEDALHDRDDIDAWTTTISLEDKDA